MRDYGKLSPSFWTRGTGKQLRSDRDAQLVYLYLSSCPSSSALGIYYLPLVTMAHELGFSLEDLEAALNRLEAAECAYFDRDAELVYVPEMARDQIGGAIKPGDKRRPWLLSELERIGEHRFVALFAERYSDSYGLEGLARGFDAPSEGHQAKPEGPPKRKPSRRVEEEMEREMEEEMAPSKGKKKSKERPLPEAWEPDACVASWLDSKGVLPADRSGLLERFKDTAIAKGWVYVDWNAGFRTFIANQIAWNKLTVYPGLKAGAAKPPPEASSEEIIDVSNEDFGAVSQGLATDWRERRHAAG